jgi:LuxR family maltose regulon positive regulatory protein
MGKKSKTTAVKKFLSSRKNLRYVWFSLNTGESDELWMWQKFCHSLTEISPELSKQFTRYGLPQTSVDRERILNIIRKTVREHTVIVIDDYHENKGEHMNLLLTAFARSAVPKLHIVIISRSIPEIPIEELALKGLCMELSQHSFEFNREETVELFERNGFLLSPEEQTLLVKNTDGWIAAIYLALLKYAENKTVEDIRDITRLIKTAVYDRFDRETQQILLKLSLLDGFSLDGAVFVTQNKKAGKLISKIAANNCFIRYDNKNGTYSIHAILKAMLLELLNVADIDKAALFSRCGDWCMRYDRRIEAVDFYRRAGCCEKILDIFELMGSAELINRAPHIIVSAFNDMDKSLKISRPLAYITYIYSYMLAIDTMEGASLLYEAKTIYEADDNLLHKEQILGEIILIESIQEFNDVTAMSEYHKKAFTLFGGTSSRIINANSIFTCGSPHTLYLYHKKDKTLLSLVEFIEKNNWFHTHVSNGCGAGFEHIARAEYCLETGSLTEAELFAYKAVYKAKTKNQLSLVICGNLCLARLAILNGRPNEAFDIMDKLRVEAEASGNPILLNGIDIAEGFIYGSLGKLERIQKWLQDGITL